MKEIEVKLRRGMTRNGIEPAVQDEIVQSITSFALYGFPESHAASFALIAYASAYLKCHYLAAFTAATLNNQPMGFYQPFTIIKDAQRHGLKVLPVDVTRSNWECTLEGIEQKHDAETRGHGDTESLIGHKATISDPQSLITDHCLRLGLLCVKGLREEAGQAIVRARTERQFSSLDDLHHRVPELRKDELRKLAAVGALNFISKVQSPMSKVQCPKPSESKQTLDFGHWTLDKRTHRRDALWQVERVSREPGPLYEMLEETDRSPLVPMTMNERLNADLRGTGITIGRHPMAHQRPWLDTMKVTRAGDLKQLRDGKRVKVAGWVIVRQRPGTAKGFVFLSLEDETGIANIIVTPQLFETNRLALVNYPFLLIDGVLQHQDNVVSVKAKKVQPLQVKIESTGSHDFH
jgi:error-prone DNA polymerase